MVIVYDSVHVKETPTTEVDYVHFPLSQDLMMSTYLDAIYYKIIIITIRFR